MLLIRRLDRLLHHSCRQGPLGHDPGLQPMAGLLLPTHDESAYSAPTLTWQAAHAGTLAFMAPEVILPMDGTYDGRCADIWSLGVTL